MVHLSEAITTEAITIQGWRFKPYDFGATPPENEAWEWIDNRSGEYIIGYQKDGNVLLNNSNLIIALDSLTPIRPYVTPGTTLEDIPVGEEVLGIIGKGMLLWYLKVQRNEEEISIVSRRTQHLEHSEFHGEPEEISVLLRPNAIKLLREKWPQQYCDLPQGVYAEYEDVPVRYREGNLLLPNSHVYKSEIDTGLLIDKNDDGIPKILGTLIGKYFRNSLR